MGITHAGPDGRAFCPSPPVSTPTVPPPLLSIQRLLPETRVPAIILVFMPRSLDVTRFSRLLSSSGPDLCSQGACQHSFPLLALTSWQPLTTRVDLESPRQPTCSDKLNRKLHCAQKGIFGVPCGPENNNGFAVKI